MVLQVLLILCGVVAFASMLVQIIGASVFDVKDIARQRRYQRQPNARKFRRRPLVTIIVHARNNHTDIINCLDSIVRGGYRKVEIIIADAGSTDATKQLIRTYQRQYPQKKITLFARRAARGFSADVLAAYKRHGRGQLVMFCHASDILDGQAVRLAVRYFNDDDTMSALSLNVQSMNQQTLPSLLERYYGFLQRRALKTWSVFGWHTTVIERGTIYRAERLSSTFATSEEFVQAASPLVSAYAADVQLWSRTAVSLQELLLNQFKRSLQQACRRAAATKLAFPANSSWQPNLISVAGALSAICITVALVVAPTVLVYCGYVALRLHQPDLLVAIITAFSVYVLHAIMNDAETNTRSKISYIVGLPITYGFACVGLCSTSLASWRSFKIAH